MAKKKVPNKSNRDSNDFDLVASGASGRWSVFVDESHGEPQEWFAQIKGPSIYVSFEIHSPQTVDQIVKFLTPATAMASGNSAPDSQKLEFALSIGKYNHFPIQLISDPEFTDRFFLVCGTTGSSLLRLALSGDDLRELTVAFGQAGAELSAQGLFCGDSERLPEETSRRSVSA